MTGKKQFLFSIATFNTQSTPFSRSSLYLRYKKFSDDLEKRPVTILNFQEVSTYDLIYLLRSRLTSYPFAAFKPSVLGPKGGLAIFSRYSFESVCYKPFVPIKMSLNKRISYHLDLRSKGTLVAKLSNMPFTIINTHLTANIDGDWSRGNRYYSIHFSELAQLTDLLDREKRKGNVILLSGDFNISKESDLYQQFVILSKMKDAFQGGTNPTYHGEFLPVGKEPHIIDYIFYSTKPDRRISCQTSYLFQQKAHFLNKGDMYLSDHIGLLAQFKLPDILRENHNNVL